MKSGRGSIDISQTRRRPAGMDWHCWLAIATLALASGCARSSERTGMATGTTVTSGTLTGVMPTFAPINDPIEPYNRSIHAFNEFFLDWIARPIVKTLRYVFYPEEVRRRIGMVGRNLAWPIRLFGNLLQARWGDAWEETERFLINTTVGIVGIFDPAAKMGLEAHPEDFGQAFATWGNGPGFYLELPLGGPSSGRDALSGLFDRAVDPAIFGSRTFFNFNDMTFTIDDLRRFTEVESDPYAMARDLWAVQRMVEVRDFQPASTDPAGEPTLKAVFFQAGDPDFFRRGKKRTVKLPTTGRRLPYNLWLQKRPAPLIYVMPGTGAHRLSGSAVAVAEMAWARGCSVVTVGSTMNWEFIAGASAHAAPGYPPDDVEDLYAALTAIDQQLEKKYSARLTRRGIVGLSLGGMHALMIGEMAERSPAGAFKPGRVVAVCPPVNLMHALDRLDEYYQAPLRWPAETRGARAQETAMKAVLLGSGELDPRQGLPFDRTEAQHLIGLFFRLLLRDAIYTNRQRHDLGLLREPPGRFSRREAYREIMRISFSDYVERFIYRPQLAHPTRSLTREPFYARADLRWIEGYIKNGDKTRVFVNEDDFLLRPEDLEWLRRTLGDRVTVMPGGGHLGNLYLPSVRESIAGAMVAE
jgi:ABC-type transporter lipoprotein component MlaA